MDVALMMSIIQFKAAISNPGTSIYFETKLRHEWSPEQKGPEIGTLIYATQN